MEKKQGIEWFDRYLTIQVALCIIVGIAVGNSCRLFRKR